MTPVFTTHTEKRKKQRVSKRQCISPQTTERGHQDTNKTNKKLNRQMNKGVRDIIHPPSVSAGFLLGLVRLFICFICFPPQDTSSAMTTCRNTCGNSRLVKGQYSYSDPASDLRTGSKNKRAARHCAHTHKLHTLIQYSNSACRSAHEWASSPPRTIWTSCSGWADPPGCVLPRTRSIQHANVGDQIPRVVNSAENQSSD